MATPLHGAHRRVTGPFAVSIEVEVGERRVRAGCFGWRTLPLIVLRRYKTLGDGLAAIIRHAEAGRWVSINARRTAPLPLPESIEEWSMLKTCAALAGSIRNVGPVLDALGRCSVAEAWSRSVRGRFAAAVGDSGQAMERALARE